jgi:hypothetical protein
VLLHKTPVINLVINEESFFGRHIALVPTIILNSFIFCLIRIKIYRRNYVNSLLLHKIKFNFRSPAEKESKVNFNFILNKLKATHFSHPDKQQKYVLYSFFNLPFKVLEHSLLITEHLFEEKIFALVRTMILNSDI